MKRLGLAGVRRGKVVRTTVPDHAVAVPAGSGQPAIQGGSSESAVGVGLHLCLDLARLAVCGLRDRCVRPPHRGLAGQPFDAHRLRPGCPGASAVCPTTGARGCVDPPFRQRRSVCLHPLHRALGRGRHRTVGRQPRRQLRQRTGRDHQRPIQGRTDPSSGALEESRSRRTRHPGMGGMVQQPSAAGVHRLYPSSRG